MNGFVYLSLGIYFAVMFAIGVYAYRRSTSTASEFLLGGRQLNPAVGALSAGASDMSGWMLMGLPGAIFVSGMSSAWIGVGLLIGACLNYHYIAPRLRVYTELADDAITIPDFLEKRYKDKSSILRLVASVVFVIFFTLYASAGLVSGGKFFDAAFGLNYELGLLITSGIVVTYTLMGGFLAVSLTDFVQGCIMFLALVIVPSVVVWELGGLSESLTWSASSSSTILSWTDGVTALSVGSAMAWGLGYFGQPHIIVRFMAIRSFRDAKMTRNIGMSWMLVTLIGAIATGLFGLAYVNKTGLAVEDPETIFIILSELLFHPIVSGFLLAAILAAIMSTISSQLLVSSSSLSEDLYKTFVRREAKQSELVVVSRICVFLVAFIASLLALTPNNSILGLVSNAWAGFGAAFGPLIILSLFWKNMTGPGAIAAIVSGALTVLAWIYLPLGPGGSSLNSVIYELVPGFAVSFVCGVLVSCITKSASKPLHPEFEEVIKILKAP